MPVRGRRGEIKLPSLARCAGIFWNSPCTQWPIMRSLLLSVSLTAFGLAMLPTATYAQAVQLPTFRQFSISGSVLVPDSGSAYLGGVNRAAYGSSQRGPWNRSSGSSVGSSGVTVRATIIDNAELDRALLAEAAGKRGATHDVLGRDIRTGQVINEGTASTYLNATRTISSANPTTSTADAIRRKAAFLSRHTAKSSAR